MKLLVAGSRWQELTAADLAKLTAIHAAERVFDFMGETGVEARQ